MSTTGGAISEGLTPSTDTDECNISVADKAPFSTSTPYWEDKARTCKIVSSRPEGIVIKQLVRELYGRKDDGGTWGGSDAEYQRIRRFINSNPNFFEAKKLSGVVFAYPTLELLDLINGGIIQNLSESGRDGDSEFCERLLQSIKQTNRKGKRLLTENLQEYIDRINDLRLVLEAKDPDVSPEYLSLPYKTRFNDDGRIKKQWSITSSSLEKAGEMYDQAVMVTLTTDPKKFDSLYEMTAGDRDDPNDTGINGNWNRLMSWLSTDSRLGYRPDYLKVLEFTEKGYPHLHAIVFLESDGDGMPWLCSKNALSNYWGKYQGEIVDLKPLVWETDLPDAYEQSEGWVRWRENGDHGGAIEGDLSEGAQTAGQYIGKYLSAVYGGIKQANDPLMTDGGKPTEEIGERYEEKAATWKIAMYWATRRKIRSMSRDLRQAVEDDLEDDEEKSELAALIRESRYEFVGAWKHGAIPAQIRNGLVGVDALMDALETPDTTPPPRPPDLNRNEELLRRAPAAAMPLIEGITGERRY